jgi:hypothetical protein
MAKAMKKKSAPAKAAKKKAAPAKATKKKAVATKAKKKTTAAVLQHHAQALLSRKLDEIIKDYCEESLLCTSMGTARGLKEIRDFFKAALNTFTPEAMANMKTSKQEIDGDYAFVIWSAPPVVSFGSDTFHVRDGKILLQTAVIPMNR